MHTNYYFVYGTLKNGHRNHHLLGGSLKVGDFTTKPEYSLLDLGSFPGVVKNGTTAIHGEIYKVSSQEVEGQIDLLEGYQPHGKNNLYHKELITIENKPVYIYILNTSVVDIAKYSEISSGKW
ncbi:gamma-glutamylcyclotransferase family protein [Seonamhaeicola marinus]|uniref:Gamma-glutamylcyclotransferase n=1 Tax=Seonamhaeicola marinus TaxID=1912246 RepID=A0A5D0HKM4_9FLAO|nr:gamma-glutamylcyclotransferase family protein [Seonamhaeicola marinus]TYA69852.1 gamma-glutamylcyclotransferase [Seonamhaeicola marinus]